MIKLLSTLMVLSASAAAAGGAAAPGTVMTEALAGSARPTETTCIGEPAQTLPPTPAARAPASTVIQQKLALDAASNPALVPAARNHTYVVCRE